MQTSEGIKRRLETAEDLRSIVRTMKGLAAATIRQYEDAVASLAEYARSVDLGLQVLLRHRPDVLTALSRQPARRPGTIVIGSDQGLCGAFNEQVAGFYLEQRASGGRAAADRPLLVLGVRAAGRLEDARVRIAEVLTLPASAALVTDVVHDLLERIDAWRAAGKVDGVDLYFNRPHRGAAFRPHREVLLPLDVPRLQALAAAPWRPRAAPTFASDWDALFSAIVREHLFVTLHRAIVESLASENASRLAAMHAAERNIDDRLSALRGEFHLHRQTAITGELLEIVSGYEAMTHGSR
ncbi:MAG: F0F1 ATP synthase subunit gamma [Vicinamibacterales bacterium]